MHGGIDKPTVVAEAGDISRSVDPVDAQSFDWCAGIVGLFVAEFHDSTKVIGIARRLAYEVDVI